MNDNQRHLLWHEAHLVLTGDYWEHMLPYLRKLMRESRNRTQCPEVDKYVMMCHRERYNTRIERERKRNQIGVVK